MDVQRKRISMHQYSPLLSYFAQLVLCDISFLYATAQYQGRDGVMVARGLVAFSSVGITMRSAFNLGSIPSPGNSSELDV